MSVTKKSKKESHQSRSRLVEKEESNTDHGARNFLGYGSDNTSDSNEDSSIPESDLEEGTEPSRQLSVILEREMTRSAELLYSTVNSAFEEYKADMLVALGAAARIAALSYQNSILVKTDGDATRAVFQIMALARTAVSLNEGLLWANSIVLSWYRQASNPLKVNQFLKIGINICVWSSFLAVPALAFSSKMGLFNNEEIQGKSGSHSYSLAKAAENYLIPYALGLPFYFLANFIKHTAIVYRDHFSWFVSDISYAILGTSTFMVADSLNLASVEKTFLSFGIAQSLSFLFFFATVLPFFRGRGGSFSDALSCFKDYLEGGFSSLLVKPKWPDARNVYLPIATYNLLGSIFWIIWYYADRSKQNEGKDKHLSEKLQPAYQVIQMTYILLEAVSFSSTIGIRNALKNVRLDRSNNNSQNPERIRSLKENALKVLKKHATSLAFFTVGTSALVWNTRGEIAKIFTVGEYSDAERLLEMVPFVIATESARVFCVDNLRAYFDVIKGPALSAFFLGIAMGAAFLASNEYDKHLYTTLGIFIAGSFLAFSAISFHLYQVASPDTGVSHLNLRVSEIEQVTPYSSVLPTFFQNAPGDNPSQEDTDYFDLDDGNVEVEAEAESDSTGDAQNPISTVFTCV